MRRALSFDAKNS